MPFLPVRRVLSIALLLAVAPAARPAPAAAQDRAAPARPALQAGADTNDAGEYYHWARERLRRQPEQAVAGFYWALRIEPGSASALYALHAARLLADRGYLVGWQENDRRTLREPAVRAIDSLRHHALMADPFVREDLEDIMLEEYVLEVVRRDAGVSNTQSALEYAVRSYIQQQSDPAFRAWLNASRGQYHLAVRQLGEVTRRNPRAFGLRVARARAFMQLGNADSAAAEMRAAITAARARDTTRMWHSYESKEALEYALGFILERKGDFTEAREAYRRALLENLGYWPAHRRLAAIALSTGDTAAAVRELEGALVANEADYDAQLDLGYVLALTGRYAEAVPHLRRATDVEPYASRPWLLLGASLDAGGNAPDAITAYRRFLATASRADPGRSGVLSRLAALGSSSR